MAGAVDCSAVFHYEPAVHRHSHAKTEPMPKPDGNKKHMVIVSIVKYAEILQEVNFLFVIDIKTKREI